MERLTKYSDDTVHENGVCCTHFGSLECYKFAGNCSLGCEWEEKAWSKLAHYEDIEEKCIEETTFGFATLLRKWKEFQDDIAQWLEWRELAKQGRLVELPCKVGEIVYKLLEYSQYRFIIKKKHFYYNDIPDFGTTVFLTGEEAEAALESRK